MDAGLLCVLPAIAAAARLFEFDLSQQRSRGPFTLLEWLSGVAATRRHELAVKARKGDEIARTLLRPDASIDTGAPARLLTQSGAHSPRVVHAKFGVGTVLDTVGSGPKAKLRIRFEDAERVLLARFVTPAGHMRRRPGTHRRPEVEGEGTSV